MLTDLTVKQFNIVKRSNNCRTHFQHNTWVTLYTNLAAIWQISIQSCNIWSAFGRKDCQHNYANIMGEVQERIYIV